MRPRLPRPPVHLLAKHASNFLEWYLSIHGGLRAAAAVRALKRGDDDFDIVEHNDLEALCAPVTPVVDDAERFGGLKAAWLAPYQVHVSKTVTMLCVDFAARDPVKDCTAVATTVQFVAREA